jgi:hypothetical protein
MQRRLAERRRGIRETLSRRELLAGAASSVLALQCSQSWAQDTAPSQAGTSPPAAIGLNLAPVRYWTSERPFNNLFLTSSPHVSLRAGGKWNSGGPLDLDANGWIRRLQPGQSAAFVIDLQAGHANTVYEVLFQGGGPNAIRIQKGNGNAFMKRSPHARLLVRMNSPIRNVIVREKGFRSGATFAQRFVERCRQFHTLRFMDWQGTNENRPIAWNTRVTDKYYTQAGGEVALEYLVELCNVTSSAMWYCVHHRADDDYVRQAAQFIKANLNNGRPVYLEHSNEVWNGKFAQHHYCKGQNPNWMQYHMQRTAEVAKVFRDEGVDVVSVLGLHSAGTWNASKALQAGVPEGIDAAAIAPYFGGRICRTPATVQAVLGEGVERILDECQQELEQRRTEVRQHRELADKHGLKLVGYEGGQHLVTIGPQRKNRQLVNLLVQANRHPRMYDLYRDYLAMWNEETDNGLMCLYYSVGQPGQSGCWGLLEYEGQDPHAAPKYRAAIDCLSDVSRNT